MYNEDNVKRRLIVAGLSELEESGIRSFSLRRVAEKAGVSCAAPYRYFDGKEELIVAIVEYMREGWDLLAEQINTLYSDTSLLISELSVAFLRFFVANGSFRTVLMAGDDERAGRVFDSFNSPVFSAIARYSKEHGVSSAEEERLKFTLLSLIYGSLTLTLTASFSQKEIADNLRFNVSRVLGQRLQ